MSKSKGFWWWPADFEAATNRLSGEAVGAYIRLLDWMHMEGEGQCSILNEPDALAIGTKVTDPELLKRIMGEIQNKYAPLLRKEHGKLVSEELRKIAAEWEVKSKECAKAGKLGVEKKQANAIKIEASAAENQADASKNQASHSHSHSLSLITPIPTPTKELKERLLADFERFWNIWPKGEKSGRGKARESWLRIKPNPDLVEKIIAAVEVYQKSERWQKGWRKNPTTWLNQECWDDELKPASAQDRAIKSRDKRNVY